ncbi:transmembrane protein 100-like [Astyanax mexicanus]|uniref:transmembrane protein 100-like n=1 Tax=Astyanax mexicanus TaxID=7994 RepID=UPI000440E6BF|nr:transmembrane protein 100-like [Astyanax mexicanus]
MTNSILVSELELSMATGGTEGSCYRCTLPFGVVLLLISIAVTAVAYSFNSHGSTISILGLVLLSCSLLLLCFTAVCWKLRRGKEMGIRSTSQGTLVERLSDSCN